MAEPHHVDLEENLRYGSGTDQSQVEMFNMTKKGERFFSFDSVCVI
jgi:hypothetical protein